jgi:FlaA1/EpsC-like NDP-sugar epimerase
MEYNPKEAVKVNIFGSHILAKAAKNHGVKKFIMISTDKAVRPTSIMGATKRMAEYVCKAYNSGEQLTVNGEWEQAVGSREYGVSSKQKENTEKGQGTKFISVRFGNVLGSRGSVLPLFLEQLKYGGPLTVTHKEMRRYFMTIPEAVSLVLQASMMGNGGEVFVLDMGEPVKIVDIAEELIRIHGMEPYRDIDIQLTGLRPGEKLFEEILTAEEGTDASIHEKVFVSRNSEGYSLEEIENILAEFEAPLREYTPDSEERVKALLKNYVKMHDNQGSE